MCLEITLGFSSVNPLSLAPVQGDLESFFGESFFDPINLAHTNAQDRRHILVFHPADGNQGVGDSLGLMASFARDLRQITSFVFFQCHLILFLLFLLLLLVVNKSKYITLYYDISSVT